MPVDAEQGDLSGRPWKAGVYQQEPQWEDIMLAVEYDGEQHRLSRDQFVKDVERLEYIRRAGWTHIRVLADHKGPDVVRRVRQAWDTLTSRR